MNISKLSNSSRRNFLTYAFVIAAYVILQLLSGGLSSSIKGMLVPICAYVVMAISLNLVVGISGELSLGHAGFMSVGAFMGVTTATVLQNFVASAPVRLAAAMLVGAVFAGIFGFLIRAGVFRLVARVGGRGLHGLLGRVGRRGDRGLLAACHQREKQRQRVK